MSFRETLAATAAEVQGFIDGALPGVPDLPMVHGMKYAMTGGKRLRGFFVIETARLHGIKVDRALPAAAAIEALHAYSLVHDDLPCMDDDDLRRGQPTVHIAWDEATAVLVGDALQTFAFELLTSEDIGPPAVRLELVSSLARAAGFEGMVLGQAQDIAAETAGAPLSLDEITALQRNKTGALIEWSCTAGAVMGQGDPAPFRTYARAIGLAFQIADDILDVEGDTDAVGKRVNKDASAGKATFVSHLGLDGAKARAAALVSEAQDAVASFGAAADTLRAAAEFVVARRN